MPLTINAQTAIEQQLMCPITDRPLTEAIVIHPCQHRVNAAALEVMIEIDESEELMDCPVCHRAIHHQHDDTLVRSLARKAFQEEVAIPYPGETSRYVCTDDDPKKFATALKKNHRRVLRFTPVNPDAMITSIEFGRTDKRVLQLIFHSTNPVEMRKFMHQKKLYLEPPRNDRRMTSTQYKEGETGHFVIHSKNQIWKFLDIMKEYNQIDVEVIRAVAHVIGKRVDN